MVGDGYLGKALAEYEGFSEYGVKIGACFDFHADEFAADFGAYAKNNNVRIGIIAVRSASAQVVCDIMTENGIRTIWNLAPCTLNVPDGVHLKHENLALSLAYLQNQLIG